MSGEFGFGSRPVNPTARGDKKRELLTALPLIYAKKTRNQKISWS